MYHIQEIGGESLTLAPEEHLVEITYPPFTRVVLVGEVGGVVQGNQNGSGASGVKPSWVVRSCRLEGKPNPRNIVYDLRNENGNSLTDELLGVGVDMLAPFTGPKQDEEGRWRS